MCGMVALGAGGGLAVGILKPHGVLMAVSVVAVVAMGVALGWFMETHLAPWHHPATEE